MAWKAHVGRGALRIGSLAALLALLAVTPHCGGSDEGEDGSEGDGSSEDTATGGTTSSGSGGDATSDTSTGGSPTDGTGGTTSAQGGSTSSDCSPELSGDSCSEGDSCTWSDTENCREGQCACNDGSYVCSSYSSSNCNTDGATCPSAIETSCGDTCDGEINGCLCRCGGGPDYTSCSCTGGSWECSSCQ